MTLLVMSSGQKLASFDEIVAIGRVEVDVLALDA
jgi:hypothetical protein